MEPRTPVRPEARLLRDLDDAQRHAVTVDASPLAILAGPGAGKTRVLTHRIAWQAHTRVTDPSRVLAVTFTRKAAGELRTRLARLGLRDAVTAGTFHGLALALLRARADDANRRFPTVLADKTRMLLRLDGGTDPAARDRAATAARAIDWARANGVTPDGFVVAAGAARRVDALPPEDLAARYAAYETERRKRGVVDFDDLLEQAATALETDPEFAAVTHWRFRHLFVDEFQDLTPAQLRLLRGWLAGGASLCVVGDPQQAIYRFAGADPSHLGEFERHFPGSTTVALTRNYRSRPEIVALTAAALGASPPDEAGAGSDHLPVLRGYPTDHDEHRALAERIITAYGLRPRWSDHAVLARTNVLADTAAERLRAAGIPCRVRVRDDDDPGAPVPDAVDVLTFHRAKGLEWPHVHLIALEDGAVPAAAAGNDPAALAEERRLFAVATSRAEDTLHLSFAGERTQYGRTDRRAPSPFLVDVRRHTDGGEPGRDGEAARVSAGAVPAPVRAVPAPAEPPAAVGLAAARARLAAAGGTRHHTSERRVLEEWRGHQARAAAVAPAAILTDHTLAVIARTRPTRISDLASIPGLGPRWIARYGEAVLATVGAATAAGEPRVPTG